MRDINYVKIQKQNNDDIWKSGEKYLYYSYKNENYILPTIICCMFLMFCHYGIVLIFPIILFIQYLCMLNNNELDNSSDIQNKREIYKKYRKDNGK